MDDLKVVITLDKLPDSIVTGLWNGDIEEPDKEHLNMVAHAITLSDLEELVAWLRGIPRKKTKDVIDQKTLRSLVILLYAILEKGGELAFEAARAYILLLQAPGTNVRNVLHPYVLRLVMNLLKHTKKSRESDPFKESKDKKRKKQKKSQDDDEDVEMGTEESTPADEPENNEEDYFPFMEHAEELMNDLKSLLKDFPFEAHSQSLLHIIEVLAEVSRMTIATGVEKSKTKKRKSKKDQPQLSNLNESAYELLTALLAPIHGVPAVTFSHILKELLPNMLHHYGGPLCSGPIAKHVLEVRADTTRFVIRCLSAVPEGDGMLDPVHVFLQHICTRVADRADSETSLGVCELLKGLPVSETTKFIEFLGKLSKTAKANQRHLSVEVAVKLLLHLQERKLCSQDMMFITLIEILVRRSSDKIATIRAKALGNVALVIQHSNDISRDSSDVALKAFSAKLLGLVINSCSRNAGKAAVGLDLSKAVDDKRDGTETERMLEFLRRRVQDEKSNVRRSSLLVLEALYMLNEPSYQVLAVIASGSSDSSPLIRKQVISSLTALIEAHPQSQPIFDAWRRVVFPLVADRESSVQDKALEVVSSVILARIVSGDTQVWEFMKDLDADSSRYLLPLIIVTLSFDKWSYLHKVCTLLVRKKSLPDGLVKSLMKAIANDDKSKNGAWILLSELAPCCPKQVDHKIILQKWGTVKENLKTEQEDEIAHSIRVLRILTSVADVIPAATASAIADDLYKRLCTFSYPPALVQSFIAVLGPMSSHNASLQSWPSAIVTKCDDALSNYVLPQPSSGTSSKESSPALRKEFPAAEIERYLFTLGEVVQGYNVTVSSRVVTVVQALLASDINSVSIPSSVRAHAFVVLGKLCLSSEPLAKRCITVFARELETSKDPVIRNNVMVVMCDLCIRYTAIVDRYIPNIAVCLRDESELVRRQTLLLLTRLLQEDYVKWKGQLFYRFVISLVDPSPQIREFAQYCLVDCLYTKNPTMFFSHFMETIFVLNEDRSHPVYNQAQQSDKERALFSLKGDEKRRMTLYTMFLTHMTDEQKFQLTAKICHEVIGDLVDGKLALSQSADVLQDSLLVLASKDIKLSSRTSVPDEEDEQESAMTAAKGKLLSKIVKKNILENIFVIMRTLLVFDALKHLLEKHRSPLLKYLMMYLKELLKDFKTELQDIVVGDKQLAKELEYDLRMWEKKATIAPTVTVLSPPSVMFSPKPRNTPRPDLAKFSVPKLRPSPNILSLQKTPKTPNGARLSMPARTPGYGGSPSKSPYKTPHKSRHSLAGDGTNIAFTPDPNRQRRWSIEMVDENDQNAPNVDDDKTSRKEKDKKRKEKKDKEEKEEKPSRRAPSRKKGKLTYDEEEVEDSPPPVLKKRRARK